MVPEKISSEHFMTPNKLTIGENTACEHGSVLIGRGWKVVANAEQPLLRLNPLSQGWNAVGKDTTP